MLAILMALQPYVHQYHYGFLGIDGFVGIIIGVIILIAVVGVLWKLVSAVATKFGADGNTIQIIYWSFVLLVLLLFLHFFGLY